MSKLFVVFVTEGWYDGDWGDVLGVFDDRDKALRFLNYKADEYAGDTDVPGMTLDNRYDTEKECVRRFNNGAYCDWDLDNTQYTSFRMKPVDLIKDIIIKNAGGSYE